MLILNDHDTGYPFAVPGELDHQRDPDGGLGRAGRRPAHAATGPDRPGSASSATGLIARYVHTFLAGTGWSFDEVGVHDLSADSAEGFRSYLSRAGPSGQMTVHDDAEA